MSRIEPEPLRVSVNVGESKTIDARLVSNKVKRAITTATTTTWSNPLTDCCGAPGGWRLCSYIFFLPPCAAGDIARESGRDFFITAMMYPLCGWWMAGDRQELAAKYKIDDTLEGPAAYCFMCCGCSFCLLLQEYNEILLRRRATSTSSSSFKSGTGTGNKKLGSRG